MFRILMLVAGCLLLEPNMGRTSDWLFFRGNPLQNGVSTAKLPETLDILWKFSTKESIEGSVSISDGIVYAGSYDEYLYAIELKTGKEKWKVKLGPMKSTPVVRKDRIYVGDTEGKFYCLDKADGKINWKFETEGEISSGCNFAGDRILIGSHDATLYCLDLAGKKLWDFKTDGPVNGSPAVVGKKTFVAGCDSILHVIDVETGKELSSVDLGGQAGATAAILGDSLYVGTMNNEVLGIRIDDSKILWKFTPEKRQMPFYASAAVTDKLIFAGSRDKRLHALDRKTGIEQWNFLTEGRIDSSPVVVDQRLIVGSTDQHIYILDAKSGKKLQDFEFDSGIIASPAVTDGYVIIATEKGSIYCLGAKQN